MAFFPPKPSYPKNYDSDYSLFLVYNTSETITTADNAPWADEIYISPVDADQDEIWADNGYANIEGELFYYDTVEKDLITGKVFKLKRCARNLGGTHTKHNLAGSEVRGFVIAEHHDQIVDAILKIEQFVGENFTEDMTTLDWRIRHLQQLPVIFDDFSCPNISFDFYIADDDPATGVLAQYDITVDGSFTSFRLDFGDGEFTTTATRGTHRYATSSTIDPVITVSNSKCTIVQTPVTRLIASEPQQQVPDTRFEILIPEIPNIPRFELPTIPIPEAVQIPPIVFPCLDISPIGPIVFPSIIEIVPEIDIPSIIVFENLPTIPSIITFVNPPEIPTLISFGPIQFIPTLISFGPIQFIPTIITFGPAPFLPTQIMFGPTPYLPTQIMFGPTPYLPTQIAFGPAPLLPTQIAFGPAPYLVTQITFGPAPFLPTQIVFGPAPLLPTYVTFGPAPAYPTYVTFGPAPVLAFPTYVTFGPAPTFSEITFAPAPQITFGPAPDYPTYVTFGPAPVLAFPTYVEFGPAPTFDTITFAPAPTIPQVTFGAPPSVQVVWGPAPTISCTVTVSCPSASPFRASAPTPITEELLDFSEPAMEIDVGEINIPTEIIVKVPEIPDIRVLHDIPTTIRVETPIFPDIKIIGPATPLPKEIVLVADNVPREIELLATNVPKTIELVAPNIPKTFKLEVPDSFPSIKIDGSGIPKEIQVIGIPKTIELIGPTEIKLAPPDKPIEVEMVYKGAPVDVKINLDISRLTGEDGNAQCVAIVPCTPK